MLKDLKYRFNNSNVLLKIIYINIVVFVLIQIVNTFSLLFKINSINLINYLGMPSDISELLFKPWTIITYMFTHTDLLHLIFNLIFLYFAGQIFMQYFNHKKLYGIYIIGGITGGLLYLFSFNFFPALANYDNNIIGASASVLAIVFAIVSYAPNHKVNLILFGYTPIKYIVIAYMLYEILNLNKSLVNIAQGNAGGHIAHIGGALIGIYFIRQWNQGKDITKFTENLIDILLIPFKKNHLKTIHKRPKTDDEFNTEKVNRSKKMDAILDKISKSGYDSLNEKEKDYLFNNSKKM